MTEHEQPTNRYAPCGFDVENEHASSRIAQGSIADHQSVGRDLLYSLGASDPSRDRPRGTLVVVVTHHEVGRGGTTDGFEIRSRRGPRSGRQGPWQEDERKQYSQGGWSIRRDIEELIVGCAFRIWLTGGGATIC